MNVNSRIKTARKILAMDVKVASVVEAKTDDRVAEKSTLIGGDNWVQLKSLKSPEDNVNGYTYSHEIRCKGHIVAAVPFRSTEKGMEYLIRQEVTPCWNLTERCPSTITGGCDTDSPADDILRELEEEASITATAEDLIELGTCRGTKSSDTVYHLFALDLTGKEGDFSTGEGDGSELEGEAINKWVNKAEAIMSHDPLVAVIILRMEADVRD